jgi:hypothetical protein
MWGRGARGVAAHHASAFLVRGRGVLTALASPIAQPLVPRRVVGGVRSAWSHRAHLSREVSSEATSSSRSNLCRLLSRMFPQLAACLSSMDVHVDVSLCRVIVTQIVTQLGDHPLRTDQREILGATRTARCSPTSPVQQLYCRSRPSRRASGARSRIPHRVTHRSPLGRPIALAVRARSSVSAACSSCACCVPVACLSLPTDDARYVITVVSRRPEP